MTELTDKLSTALADRYRIERRLGEGGMATVYLAEDLKHDRKVALKILRSELAAVLGAERFVQEIKMTANLQHPHILPLFDSGEADGFLYYVMPFIDGETLRDKLNAETQLGIDEAVRITCEVADALDYAHRQSVIHRDIKPENVLLHDGRAMIADFGIALAVSAAAGGRMTETGLSLGTPHYMSPEQATAEKDITPRSDIYSLGAVLYEMLTGDPPHVGPTAQSIVMRILTEEPRSILDVRKSVPPHVAAAVGKVLEKLPADRFESANAFASALRDASFTHAAAGAAPSAEAVQVLGAAIGNKLSIGLAAVAVIAVVAAFIGWTRSPEEVEAPPPVRLVLEYPEMAPRWLWGAAVSPDGRFFALPTPEGLQVRRADQTSFRVLPGTNGATDPTFSPDGAWIAYLQGPELHKVGVDGSASLTLVAEASMTVQDPAWGEDGNIVFASPTGVYIVPGTGGTPRRVGPQGLGRHPRLLPDGSGVIVRDQYGLALLDLATDSLTPIVSEGTDGVYVETGHIIYCHPEGGLFAIAFDLATHAVTGDSTPIMSEIVVFGSNALYTVSRNGTLLYPSGDIASGGGVPVPSHLVVLTPGGRLDTVPLAPRVFGGLSVGPDGQRVAFNTGAGRTLDRTVHTHDLLLGTTNQISFEGGGHRPVWSPDGTRVVYSARGEGSDAEDLYIKAVDGSAPPSHVVALPGDQHASDWPSEHLIVFNSQFNILMVDISAEDPEVRPYLRAEYGEGVLVVSPSGDLAAYASNELGDLEIFVRRFPNPEGQWKISDAGGWQPRWAPDGETLYYQTGLGSDTIIAVSVPQTPPITPTSRRIVAVVPGLGWWDVDRTSGNLVMTQATTAGARREREVSLLVVVNWFEELRSKMGQ